eukprot:767701-Hanusia_phi.AAC.5
MSPRRGKWRAMKVDEDSLCTFTITFFVHNTSIYIVLDLRSLTLTTTHHASETCRANHRQEETAGASRRGTPGRPARRARPDETSGREQQPQASTSSRAPGVTATRWFQRISEPSALLAGQPDSKSEPTAPPACRRDEPADQACQVNACCCDNVRLVLETEGQVKGLDQDGICWQRVRR